MGERRRRILDQENELNYDNSQNLPVYLGSPLLDYLTNRCRGVFNSSFKSIANFALAR